MKHIDINRKFTAAVNSYLAQGYYFNTTSMGGSQGEVAAVDLTDGKQIVRILLDDFTEWEDNLRIEGLVLIVGVVTDDVTPNDSQRRYVAWNDHLKVISHEKFYRINAVCEDNAFYGGREDAISANKKRFDRYCASDCRIKRDLPEKASPLVKEFVRRKFGVKRVVVSNIRISKSGNVYTVTYNNRIAPLH